MHIVYSLVVKKFFLCLGGPIQAYYIYIQEIVYFIVCVINIVKYLKRTLKSCQEKSSHSYLDSLIDLDFSAVVPSICGWLTAEVKSYVISKMMAHLYYLALLQCVIHLPPTLVSISIVLRYWIFIFFEQTFMQDIK